MRNAVLGLVVLGCGGSPANTTLPPTDPSTLMATLTDLAAFGNKHAGTPEGAMTAAYIGKRMTDIGLEDVHTESFTFAKWDLTTATMTVTIDGVDSQPMLDVFESSGAGSADADIIDVNTATDGDLNGVDLTGKIALVVRDPSFHRAAQYKNVTAKGAVAMLYLSIAPDNLRQVGSVRFDWETMGTIPAITIGSDDGTAIKAAVDNGKTVHAKIDCQVTSAPATGANVIGKITGERPETIVLGAHYDTWFTGSTDNGSGIAELLDIADRRVQHAKPHYTLVFVAYDGEEVGLYGGYDYLRKHDIVGHEPILAVMNFETPSAIDADIIGLVHSNQPALDFALQSGHLRGLYEVYAGMEIVAQLFGGIIPTDIQGTYRSGVPTVSTAATNPYYHTIKDTPDQVDLTFLGSSADDFDTSLDYMFKDQPTDFAVTDPKLWQGTVTTTPGGDSLTVDATFTDATGAPQASAIAAASVMYDDFMLATKVTGTTDATGHVQFHIPTAMTQMGSGNRFLHVTAGPTYPLVEKISALP